MKKYDVIIIGGGHNGLTAAASLAKNGKKVVLFEKRIVMGGLAAGEAFFPGFTSTGLLHDTSCVRPGIVQDLNLHKFGLQTTGEIEPYHIFSKDGQSIRISGDLEATVGQIERISPKDAIAYRAYRQFIDKIGAFIIPLMNDIPPDLVNLGVKELFALGRKGLALKRLGNKTMTELLRLAPMSVADFLNERFETDFLKAGLAAPALQGSFTAPMSSYTTLNLLLHECLAKENIVGGPAMLVDALQKSAENFGAELRNSSTVQKILLNESGRVTGVRLEGGEEINAGIVTSGCTPKTTFLDFLPPNQLAYSLEHNIQHYRSRGTSAKVNLAIRGNIEWKGQEGQPISRVLTGNSLIDMEKAFDPIKYGHFSNDPILDICVPSIKNSQLAPPDNHVLSVIVHYVPYKLKGGWTARKKEELGQLVKASLATYINDLGHKVSGMEILTPVDLESRYSLTDGHIYHGEHAIDQLMTRPIPVCARYDTPIPGLYLCGSGAFPGGGITCAPGYLAARRILGK